MMSSSMEVRRQEGSLAEEIKNLAPHINSPVVSEKRILWIALLEYLVAYFGSLAKPSSSRTIRIRSDHCLVANETYKVNWEQR